MSEREGFETSELDEFLRENAPRVPPARGTEKARIWRAIVAGERGPAWYEALFSVRKLSLAAIGLAVLTIAVSAQVRKRQAHDHEVDRVLTAALAYQLEDDGVEGF